MIKSGTQVGGFAALLQAVCYIFGFVMLATVMNPGDIEGWTQVQKLQFVLERTGLFHLWNIVIYVVFGVALIVLTVVLHRYLQESDSLLLSITTPFGFIWAGLVIASGMISTVGLSAVSQVYTRSAEEATQLWTIVGVVQNGLGGGVEVVGGIWVLLLSWVSFRCHRLPGALNWIGIVVGVTGIATIVPALSVLGAVFGLTQIVWFLGLGVVLLRIK